MSAAPNEQRDMKAHPAEPQTQDDLAPGVQIPEREYSAPEEYIHESNQTPGPGGEPNPAEPGSDAPQDSTAHEPNSEAEQPVAETKATAADAAAGTNWQEQYLRLMAEFENFKRRTNKEKEQLARHAGEQLLRTFLPVLDDVERSLKAAETSDNVEKLREGLQLVHRNFNSSLHKQGVEVVEAEGKPFDSELHEAIASIPVDDATKKGLVIEVFERGYTYQGKVLRYAKVVTGE